MIDFNHTAGEARKAEFIADRYRQLQTRDGIEPRAKIEIEMDIIATHKNGCPLDLQKLCKFDDFNFVHDVAGIERHLDRETGKLDDLFLPRCAR